MLILCFRAHPIEPPPRVFFTDLESGPNVGGENNLGAFVTIYGKGFGAQRGDSTVTTGGGAVATYRLWSDSKIIVQLGPAAWSGALQVNTRGGRSQGARFTVRPGAIYFAGPGGSDRNPGSFDQPFETLVRCKAVMASGDICYAMDGLTATRADTFNGLLTMTKGGTKDLPMAIVAYPNARARIGDPYQSASLVGIRIPNTNVSADYWVIAGFDIQVPVAGILIQGGRGSRGWRVVGNRFSCPAGDGALACVETSSATDVKFLGNEVYRTGCSETDVPCATVSANFSIRTQGVTLTSEGASLYPLLPGSRVFANGQSRIVVSVSSKTSVLDAPFDPDLTEPTRFSYRFPRPSKLYHAVYFSTDSNSIEAAWNHLHDNRACRGIQFHSSPTISGLAAPATAAVEAVPGGALPARTYTVQATYMVRSDQYNANNHRETTASAAVTIAIPQGALLRVRTPAGSPTATGWSVFASAAGSPTRQNPGTDPIPLGTDWTEPESGLIAGQPLPTANSVYQNGYNQWDLSVHDNLIQDTVCDAINFATVDPSKGPVRAYNNVIVRGGGGPDPPPDPAGYSCIYIAGATNLGADGKGAVEIFNNTMYGCGARGGSSAAAIVRGRGSPSLLVTLKNNVAVLNPNERYLASTLPGLVEGTNNIWTGSSQPLGQFAQVTNNISEPVEFVDPDGLDFHPRAAAALQERGARVELEFDFDGLTRSRTAPAIGAFEGTPVTVLDAASLQVGPVVSGGRAYIVGADIGPATPVANTPEQFTSPKASDPLSVLFDGAPAPVLSAHRARISVVVPYEIHGKDETRIQVLRGGEVVFSAVAPVARSAPAIYGQGGRPSIALALNEDLTVNSAENPAAPGSWISLYVNSTGQTDPPARTGALAAPPYGVPVEPLSVFLNDQPVSNIAFAAQAPNEIGVTQIVMQIPPAGLVGGWTSLRVRVGERNTAGARFIYVRRSER